jgi:hypothetical protein
MQVRGREPDKEVAAHNRCRFRRSADEMTELERALTVREIEIDGKSVRLDEIVWVHRRGTHHADVEYRGRCGRVPASAIVQYPVPAPPLEELRQLDSCFGLGDAHFELECRSSEHYYEILTCRTHGRRFLRDVRGTSAWFSTTTLLEEDEEGTPDEIWSRHHGKSHSWLMLERRTL